MPLLWFRACPASGFATCSASSTGLCQGSVITTMPSRNDEVHAPTQMSRFKVAEIWPKPVK